MVPWRDHQPGRPRLEYTRVVIRLVLQSKGDGSKGAGAEVGRLNSEEA